MKKHKNFKQKNNFILNKVCHGDLDKFTELFYIKGAKKPSFKNRKTYIKAKWLVEEVNPVKFIKDYQKYPFSNLTSHGKLLFKNAEEFLNIDLMGFEEKIESYIEYKNMLIIPEKLDYKYLYVYNKHRTQENKHLDYYEIEHVSREDNSIEIVVKPPKHKESLNIEAYKGILKQENNKIILNFYNSDDYITAIFNSELSNDFSDALTGVAIGIADINKKIPVAKKVVLSKTAITDMNELYLTLNESETISSEEDYYSIKHHNTNFKKSHLEKYAKKVDGLNNLFKTLSELDYFNSFYEQLAFKEFSSLNHIFQKIKHNKSYYTSSRQKILEILMDSYHSQKYTTLNMVMPIYQSDNIFEHQSKHALTIQKRFLELSKKISINIIFVIKECHKPFSKEFEIFLTQIKSSANISFSYKKNIEYEVNSIDFIYTDNNYTISKYLRLDNPVFYIVQDMQTTVDEHQASYRKIDMRSISYEEFTKNRTKICTKTNPLLKNLSGKWHFYIHGSKQFWDDEIYIFEDGRVEYYSEGKRTEIGKIITKEYDSVMLLDDPITKRGVIVVFDNQHYKIQKAFFAKVIAKQMESDLDMFSIGLFSRKAIAKDKAMEILGDVDGVRLLESVEMYRRLTNYLVENI